MLKVEKLNKYFGQFHVLKDISLEIQQGEIVALIGHNGAGKSTLIHCLTQVHGIDSGEIVYDFDRKKIYDHISVQFQENYYEDNGKVYDICKLYKKLTKSKKNIDEVLSQFDLYEKRNLLVKHLSGGQKQRLSILLTLFNSPKIIFFDELTTGLDPVARREIWAMIRKINKEENVTIFLTSHFLDEVEFLADRLFVIKHGEIVLEGRIKDLLDQYSKDDKWIEVEVTSGADKLKFLPFERVSEKEDVHRFKVEADREYAFFEFLIQNHIVFQNVKIKQMTLEEIFIQIGGYAMNDEGDIVNG